MGDEIDQIKEKIDVAELISEYVTLRRAGQHFKGLCPFHQEKTPSFTVSPHKGMWHCFGCGLGGDIFVFIQKIEGTDFKGALTILAERAGVEIKAKSGISRDERQRLFETLNMASRLYHEILMNQPLGKKAKEYLIQRGVIEETMGLFQIGYAPPAWDTAQKFLQRKGFTLVELETVGLIGKASTGRYFDRFRGRIMFPVSDIQGRVIAFGGRITPFTETGKEGKYINSPETRLYSKRHTIYNLHQAKQALRHQEPCLVVEGYMDVVMLTQAGIHNVVASSGTAFTPEHIQQLSRFTTNLHFAFDADPAGWKAALSATRSALSAGMRVATIQFPAGKDPADVVLENPDKVQEYISQPRSLISIMVDQIKKTTDQAVMETSLQDLLPFMALVKNPVQQGEMIQEIATALHIPESRVMNLVQQAENRPVATPVPMSTFSLTAEQYLFGLVIAYPAVREAVFPHIRLELLLDGRIQELYKLLENLAHTQPDFFTMTPDALLARLPADTAPLAEGLRALLSDHTADGFSPVQETQIVFRSLQRRFLERQLSQLQRQLAAVEQTERLSMLQQFQSVAEELEKVRAEQ